MADLNIKFAVSRKRFICGPMLSETFLLILVCSFIFKFFTITSETPVHIFLILRIPKISSRTPGGMRTPG
jgi:hypothetical protein